MKEPIKYRILFRDQHKSYPYEFDNIAEMMDRIKRYIQEFGPIIWMGKEE